MRPFSFWLFSIFLEIWNFNWPGLGWDGSADGWPGGAPALANSNFKFGRPKAAIRRPSDAHPTTVRRLPDDRPTTGSRYNRSYVMFVGARTNIINQKFSKLVKKYKKNRFLQFFKITKKLLKNYIDIFAVFKITKKLLKNYILNTDCTAKRCILYFWSNFLVIFW